MGLSIGSASIAVSSVNATAVNRPNRSEASRVSEAPQTEQNPAPERNPVRAGFGENTLSPLGAALETLDTNLEVAEEIVPTVQELREQSRVNQAQLREDNPTFRSGENTGELRRRESVRPEPDPAVQNFVQDVGAVEERSTPEAVGLSTAANAPETPQFEIASSTSTRVDFFA